MNRSDQTNNPNARERNLLQTIQNFANRYGEPLVSAFVSVVTGTITAALGGNIVHGIQIAATGVANLLLAIVQTPVENVRSLSPLHQFTIHSRHFAALLLTPVLLIVLVTGATFVALFVKLLRTRK
jgi:hypothetical protein